MRKLLNATHLEGNWTLCEELKTFGRTYPVDYEQEISFNMGGIRLIQGRTWSYPLDVLRDDEGHWFP